MTADQWRRVRELFEGAIDRTPEEAAGWVDREAAGDSAVRAEVLSLLEHHSRAGSFLDAPVTARVPDLLDEGDDEARLTPGGVVGSYTIVREIGRGGMGRVYLATDNRLARTVALKALAPHLTRDASQRERLRREARAAAALSHPGICTVYALDEIGDDLYIASEFVDGHTLREEIASGQRPSSDTIVDTARQLASALASAHARGVAHRDLKPENVMRTADGRLKILDFGLARIDSSAVGVDDHTHSPARALVTLPGVLLGTPAYMAPEQLNGQPADARTDVFAFGVLMYEFACGVHPFDAGTELARLARVLDSEARPLDVRCPHAPPAFAAVIDRCLRKAPAERFATAAEIVTALDRHAQDSPRRNLAWWRTHQLTVMALYIVAATVGWSIKETLDTRSTMWLFVVLGIGGAVAGIVRGHLLFTEQMNRTRLASERRRTRRSLLTVDLAIAAALFVDGLVLAQRTPLWAVMTMAVALGIALAAVLMEPATSEAAFGTSD